ncbi:tetratricopeptide repeat protein [Desulfosarcina sp.]|uniref:tetratricopeptide repeat protein n=1 Tax=Desulfosarcina sp. TaxID=2027861 RepID=UPI003562C1B7
MTTCKPLGLLILAILLIINPLSHASDDSRAYQIFKQGLDDERQLRIYEARERYIAALAESPTNQGFLSHYAWFLTRYGFSEEAADVFSRLMPLADDKEKTALYLGLAWNRQVLGQLEASLDMYKRRFPITAIDMPGAFEQIRWHRYEENHKKINRLKNDIASGSDALTHQRALVEVCLDQGALASAIALAEDLRDQGELDLKTHLFLARALFWSGALDRAAHEYAALNDRSPENAFLNIEWADVLVADERLPEAQALLEKSLALYPQAAAGRRKLAEVLARQHEDQRAIEMAESIAAEKNDRLTGLLARARARHFSGHIQNAQPIYAQILKEYPLHPDALWGMTETSIYTGRDAEARRTLHQWENAIEDPRMRVQQKRLKQYTAPHLSGIADFYSNSSDFSRTDMGLESGWHMGDDWRLNAGYRFSGFFQSGFEDVFRNTFLVGARKGVSERLLLTTGLSGNNYDNDHNSLNGELGLAFQMTPELSIQPHFRHVDVIDTTGPFENMAYSHTVTIGSVGMHITADEYGLRLDYLPLPRLSFSCDYRYADYSDDNQKHYLSSEAGYRFSLQPDWRMAYNYFYLDYRDPAPLYRENDRVESAYYDPINFETHTLRLVFRHDNGERWFYGSEGALSYIPKSNGTGTYLSAFVGWRFKQDMTFRIDARGYYQNRGVDRVDTTGYFWANNVMFKFDYRF